ncbi:hypothetical protein JG688_00016399 [Phytophthora aleatoria]|uniref:Uncharacterized protein n=1 Tax=Phytophthora aleatoria TaxID=2496075 RepID=A0A8J5I4E9_9STRA|nr:hypothetical protein JG688_00016399 [Phytophthora aleatoria]
MDQHGKARAQENKGLLRCCRCRRSNEWLHPLSRSGLSSRAQRNLAVLCTCRSTAKFLTQLPAQQRQVLSTAFSHEHHNNKPRRASRTADSTLQDPPKVYQPNVKYQFPLYSNQKRQNQLLMEHTLKRLSGVLDEALSLSKSHKTCPNDVKNYTNDVGHFLHLAIFVTTCGRLPLRRSLPFLIASMPPRITAEEKE